jgi:hypothetical protein
MLCGETGTNPLSQSLDNLLFMSVKGEGLAKEAEWLVLT